MSMIKEHFGANLWMLEVYKLSCKKKNPTYHGFTSFPQILSPLVMSMLIKCQ